jgi:competence ComEA-like helix-hairpin-helix protein
MLNRFRKLGFTKQDLVIIAFLLVTFIVGLVIRQFGWKNTKEYDYTLSDQRFELQLKEAFKELPKSNLNAEQKKKLAFINSLSDSLSAEKDIRNNEELKQKFGKKININLAYTADLQRLPGIGEVMADRIIEFREQYGNYKRIEDIMLVKGIGIKKFEKVRELITVE